jgi:hypothetical protein
VKPRSLSILLVLAATIGGCRHRVNESPVPLPVEWQHCWWTVIRSTLPPDSVASAFRRAFISIGLPNIRWTRNGDTILVRGGPAPMLPEELDTASYGATYWSRIVAFPQQDSTHFRIFTSIVPPTRGWRPPETRERVMRRDIRACEAIARAAGVRWIKRPGDPGAEEALPVWSRVP